MFHGHTSVFSRTASRRLLVFVTGILIVLGAAILTQAALTEEAEADSPEEEAAFMDVDESLIDTDEMFTEVDEAVPDDAEGVFCDNGDPQDALCDGEPADTADADETNDGAPACDGEAVPDGSVDTEYTADADEAVFVLLQDPVDPEPLTDDAEDGMEAIETEADDESDPAGAPLTIENTKLRSGGVSADPMDVLLGVVAQHQRQGNNIQVISSDPMTGRVVYATD